MASRRRGQKSLKGSVARGAQLRIIGGKLGGRAIRYNGDPGTRPMKERVREAAFNLIGPAVKGKAVLDLFAGTGAMGFEALSRGASRATLIERSFPNARLIRENADTLEISARVTVVTADTFIWSRHQRDADQVPVLVFCCPPYDYYLSRYADIARLLKDLIQTATSGSLIVVESDQRFDTAALPQAGRWDVRRYAPAQIGLLEV